MEVHSKKIIGAICRDYNISAKKKVILKPYHFRVINGKRKIKAPGHSVIVDKQGNEYSYMLGKHNRNEEKLVYFDHIYYLTDKTINEVAEEVGIKLQKENARISEGNGWFSNGTRYYYKGMYAEK